MGETLDIPADSSQEAVVPAQSLRDLIVKVFEKKGMFGFEADLAADRLVEADLRGIHSHGSRTLKRYVDAMDTGDIDPRAQMLTLNETPAMAVFDAGKGLGHVAASKAMKLAIEKAKEVGTGTVAVSRSQHFGAASVYALLAVKEQVIGYCTPSTGGATVTAYGSKEPATANNAFAWGVPTRHGAPFVLDMACAISSWGKIESLGMYGGAIPNDWALDAEGNATVDPKSAKTLLPAAGARGYGLAFLCSVLAGPLVGQKMPLHKTRSPARDGSEHFFYAIDPSHFGEADRFFDEVQATITDIKALTPAEGFDKVRIPGELEWERAERWQKEGIPLHCDHVKTLTELADTMKIDVPW